LRWIYLLLAALYLSAAQVDTMDVDASQYAEISREMTTSQNWLEVYDRGQNYLDKPPMLFWLSAASMKIFGVGNFGFKLPSILAALLAVYATYRLGRRLRGERAGRIAALVLGTCQGMFLMTNDIRTDTLLTAFVVTALWAIAEAQERRRWFWVLLGTAAIAAGMCTKGPIALIVPLAAWGSHWLLHRQWRRIFSPHHLLDFALIALFLVPMCIGLYTQYDLHPEKVIAGKTGTSGLRFFFWTQSFGRITGENAWENGAGPEFLATNMLWSFLPWMTLLLPALWLAVARLLRSRFRPQEEWVSAGGFLITYGALALSRYQLPHYIFVGFPLAAVCVAGFLDAVLDGKYARLARVLRPVQWSIASLLWVGVAAILWFVFPVGIFGWMLWAASVAVWLAASLQTPRGQRAFWVCVFAMMGINTWLTHHFYPALLQYQMGSVAGRAVHRADPTGTAPLLVYRVNDELNSLPFYARRSAASWDTTQPLPRGTFLLTQGEGMALLARKKIPYQTVHTGRRFKVSMLTLPFLNRHTRAKASPPYFLLRTR